MNSILTVAIPTYKRARLLAETLDAFLPQVAPYEIPICISYTEDGGETAAVIEAFRQRYPHITASTDPSATNIDRKMVAVVALASTRYVWLFGDDDLPEPDAIAVIMSVLSERDWGMLVVNASSYDTTLTRRVEERRMRVAEDRIYPPGDHERLLADTASYTTFLGGVVFDRELWLSIDPRPYYDSDYAHVAVLYRGVVGRYGRLVAKPLLRMRLGSATWANRYFEVELVHWPSIVWGLPVADYSSAAKGKVCQERPAASLKRLLATRAYGFYGPEQYRTFIAPDPNIPSWRKVILRLPLLIPGRLAARMLAFFRRVQRLWGDPNVELTLYRMKA